MRQRHQRPKVQNLETKWKLAFWDYSSGAPQKRSKVWAKSRVSSQREAQRLADGFMEKVNVLNNRVPRFDPGQDTFAALMSKCREHIWPHLKNSTESHYEYFMEKYLLPEFGKVKLRKLNTYELQEYFNSFHPRLSAKTIKSMHACFRLHLNQAKVWEMIDHNPAIGVRLPRKRARKPTVLLALTAIRQLLETLPLPTNAVVVLIVFGSMRVGEVLALRWRNILQDRIRINERLYDGKFDDVKTDAGKRDVPYDQRAVMKSALRQIWQGSKFRQPDDLVFCTRDGKPLERRNLLRHIKAAALKLKLADTIDFRSFRTMHCSLMLRSGARPEVARDNLGHSNIDVTQNVYGKTWWDERTTAVTAAVDFILSSPEVIENKEVSVGSNQLEPFNWSPSAEADAPCALKLLV